MAILNQIIAFLLLITVMSAHAQEPFSAHGNCTKRAYGFVSIKSEAKNIPPIYCMANGFSEGLAAIKSTEKWGYIDANDKAIIDFKFDYAASFKHGQAIVQKGGFRGVINKKGNYVIQPIYLDLQALTIAGKLYYLSRDGSFFAGLIDSAGNEVMPHRFTYILPMEGYANIPFYTVFQEIDSAKGSFYEQFKEDAFQFSPEIGRHDIYDLQFDKLVSKQSTDYSDWLPHYQLHRIDEFLKENRHKSGEEKVEIIDSLLTLPEPDSIPQTPNPALADYARMTSDVVSNYLDSLGYLLFTQDGKTGLKKGNDILIPAKHTGLKRVNGVVRFPQQADIPILEAHYGGVYRDKKEGTFDVFAVIPPDGKPAETNNQYSLSGEIILPIERTNETSKTVLAHITSLGFLYFHTTKSPSLPVGGDGGKEIRTYSLINWKGDELLPPVYRKIEVLKTGHVLVTQEKEVQGGVEEHFGLFSSKGEEIIPLGVYSTIKPFNKSAENLYLATWSDPYPTIAEKKASRDANNTYIILKVEGSTAKVVNTFTASNVYPWHLDVETGMLWYHRNLINNNI